MLTFFKIFFIIENYCAKDLHAWLNCSTTNVVFFFFFFFFFCFGPTISNFEKKIKILTCSCVDLTWPLNMMLTLATLRLYKLSATASLL